MTKENNHPAQPRPEDQRGVGVVKRNITTGFILSVTALVAIFSFSFFCQLQNVPPWLLLAVNLATMLSYCLCFLAPVALVLCIRDRRRYRSMGSLLGIMASLFVTCYLAPLITPLLYCMMQLWP